MVKKQKALIISIGSALFVGLVHFIAHRYVHLITTLGALQILYVGLAVMVTVFLIGYIGMVRK